MPNTPWAEFFISSPPGVPLEEAHPNNPTPKESHIKPNPGAGFGIPLKDEWFHPIKL
jgi:hypothetical protein